MNAAYTSQMDSFTGLLHGRREGDRVFRINGDVLQADANAARNVRNRTHDQEITRFMPHLQVKQILLARSSGVTGRLRLKLDRASRVNEVRINPMLDSEQLFWNKTSTIHARSQQWALRLRTTSVASLRYSPACRLFMMPSITDAKRPSRYTITACAVEIRPTLNSLSI